MERGRGSTRLSRLVHTFDRVTSRPFIAPVVGALVVVYVVALAIAGFPDSWQVAFATACAAVTTVMVFTIQHTQSREQAATQLKLDELIHALPAADDRLVHVESGADAELAEFEQRQVDHHIAIRAVD